MRAMNQRHGCTRMSGMLPIPSGSSTFIHFTIVYQPLGRDLQ